MTLNSSQQALCQNMGQNKTDSDKLVTLVRRKYMLEEAVISREQFDKYNKNMRSGDFSWRDIDWKDAQWDEFCEEKTYYSAYEGDVTSFTDDIVGWMQPDPDHRMSFEPLTILNSDDYFDEFNE
tara:strand:- start:1165 stop:1536 length:372 start_codon:yes stop_codon:yes gene_type:complete